MDTDEIPGRFRLLKNHIFISVKILISELQKSFLLRRAADPFQISFTKWLCLRYAFGVIEVFSSSLELLTFWNRKYENIIKSCENSFLLVRLANSSELLTALEDEIGIPGRPCNILCLIFCTNPGLAESWL